MGDVTDFLQALPPDRRAAVEHVRDVVLDLVPDATEGTSYGVPALFDRGRPLLGFASLKADLSLYPYSGAVVAAVVDDLAGFRTSSGAIRYTPEHPVPDDVLRRVVELRRAEITRGRG